MVVIIHVKWLERLVRFVYVHEDCTCMFRSVSLINTEMQNAVRRLQFFFHDAENSLILGA